jgi:hypothetical protein
MPFNIAVITAGADATAEPNPINLLIPMSLNKGSLNSFNP